MKPVRSEKASPQRRRVLLKDKAYETLKQQILSDQYPPGSALPERRLAEDMGMSKTPIKAALERLELEGYITIAPQQFVRVCELGEADLADQYEMRTALESYIVRRLAGQLSPEQTLCLRANLEQHRELRGSDEVARRVQMDAAFHLLLAEILGNHAIMRSMSDSLDRFYRMVTKIFKRLPDRYDEVVEEHAGIVQAILDGDGELAERLMVEHLQRGRQTLVAKSVSSAET